MTTHILSMTYQPKIEGVRNGTIRQTIRLYNEKRPFKVGDKLLIHGWAGKPYRSRWNWKANATIQESFEIECHQDYFIDGEDWLHHWNTKGGYASDLASEDGISPSTGLELKAVLERYHGKFTDKLVRFQVIRW